MAAPIVTTSQLAMMRAVAERALPGTAAIHRRTLTTDNVGGWADSYSSVGTVACRLAFQGTKTEPTLVDMEEGGTVKTEQRWIITLPYGTDIRETDRIVTGGSTFVVISGMETRSYELTRRVLVKKV